MTKILLADDHQVVRQGLRALLEGEPGFTVVGEASKGDEVVGMVEALRPDVLMLDLMMPGSNGLDVLKQLEPLHMPTRTIVLSMHSNEAYVLEALKYGAIGYALKDSSAEELVKAVREVANGRSYLSPPLSERAIALYMEKARAARVEATETLTSREQEVLLLVAKALSNAEIAEKLSISPRTAEAHRANLMRKLRLHSQGELVRYAVDHGLVTP